MNIRASMATHHFQELSSVSQKRRHQPEFTAHLSSILTAPEGEYMLLRATQAGGKHTLWKTRILNPPMDVPQLLPPPLFISLVPTVYLTAPHCPATAEERRVKELPIYHQGSLHRREKDMSAASHWGLGELQQRKNTQTRLWEKQGRLCLSMKMEKDIQALRALVCNIERFTDRLKKFRRSLKAAMKSCQERKSVLPQKSPLQLRPTPQPVYRANLPWQAKPALKSNRLLIQQLQLFSLLVIPDHLSLLPLKY